MLFEPPDDARDDPVIVVGLFQIGGYRGAAADQQAVVAGQSEIGVDQLRIPALHLLSAGEQPDEVFVGERLADAQERLRVKDLVRQRTDVSLELVDSDDDVIGRDAATAREGGMAFEPDHFRALEHLHAVVDEHVLESLQAKQRIDAIGAGVADAGGISLGPENALERVALVDGLVGKVRCSSGTPPRTRPPPCRACRDRETANPAPAVRIRC